MWLLWSVKVYSILQEVPVGDETMDLERLLGYAVGFLQAMGVYSIFSVMLAALVTVAFTKTLLSLLSR